MFNKSNIILLSSICYFGQGSAQTSEPIKDNSFLVEEAYNQEKVIVQHINMVNFNSDFSEFEYSFTQEWPLGGMKHQFSYSLPFQYFQRNFSLQNVVLNYRYQLIHLKKIYFAPRASLIFSLSGSDKNFLTGTEVNLPLSYEISPKITLHVTEGANYISDEFLTDSKAVNRSSYFFAGSVIYSPSSRFNILCEAVYNTATFRFHDEILERENTFILNPGLRGAIDFKSGLQVVPGISLPLQYSKNKTETSLLFYLSFEHPFTKSHEHTD
ncbi:MAG: hypothetical protein JJE25_05965 [Bacteroidia bacterium]|nr:hypothetical protein [Bacteroidia bacterium]